MIEIVRLHAIVIGRVQGVGFRSFVRRTAVMFGVVGWVRNRFDGTVEFVAEADRNILDSFLTTIKKGNRFSNVHTIDCDWGQPEGHKGFEVEY